MVNEKINNNRIGNQIQREIIDLENQLEGLIEVFSDKSEKIILDIKDSYTMRIAAYRRGNKIIFIEFVVLFIINFILKTFGVITIFSLSVLFIIAILDYITNIRFMKEYKKFLEDIIFLGSVILEQREDEGNV